MDDIFVKDRLKAVLEESIEFSKHATDNFIVRGFNRNDIIKLLKDTEKILEIEHQPDSKHGKKYKIWIEKSHKYNFVIVINIINGKIRVVTFHLESSKRMEKLRKWLKRK